MIVPSIIAYSKSGSPDKTLKIRSNTPFFAHRRNRLNTEFHGPNSSGRSPRRTDADFPQDSLKEEAIVVGGTTGITVLAGQQTLQTFPLVFSENKPQHPIFPFNRKSFNRRPCPTLTSVNGP